MISELQSVFREARERIAHDPDCDGYSWCECSREERFLALLAQGVEAAIEAAINQTNFRQALSMRQVTKSATAYDEALAALRAVVAGNAP